MPQTNLQDFLHALAGAAFKAHIEPRLNKAPLWDNGVGALAKGVINAAVPPVTGDDVAARVLAMFGIGRNRLASGRRIPLQYDASQPGQGRVIDVSGGPA